MAEADEAALAAAQALIDRAKEDPRRLWRTKPVMVVPEGATEPVEDLPIAPAELLKAVRLVSVARASASMNSEKAREKLTSLVYRLKNLRTTFDDAGKDLGEDARERLNRINAVRRGLKDGLQEIEDDVAKPLEAWKKQQAERKASHDAVLASIARDGNLTGAESSDEVQARINRLRAINPGELDEYATQAKASIAEALKTLQDGLGAARKREDDQRELDRLQAEEKKRLDAAAKEQAAAAEAKRVADRAAWQAKETARIEADTKARLEWEAEMKAEREQMAREEAAEAERREKEARQADAKNRNRILGEIADAVAAVIAECATPEDMAREIAAALADGRVPHTIVEF